MDQRDFSGKQLIIVKVGSSTLSFSNGRLNLQRLERLVKVTVSLKKQGKQIVLVSSGAVAVGGGLLGMKHKPDKLEEKQALAAVGQAELMKIYQKFFEPGDQIIAQVLLTKDGLQEAVKRKNAANTLTKLLNMDIIPVINENDTVSTYGIEFGNNDILAARVAELLHAGLLIILSDIDGFFTADPKSNRDAALIHTVHCITDDIRRNASGSGNSFGTGGMAEKLEAANICLKNNIDVVIANGERPDVVLDILKGKPVGTLFSVKTTD
ncbi:MAG: glutamate 5-kinase [Chlorobi bacterium]|nr:glutamate 5-kinase [Chlorobiota bacterium]